MIGEYIFREDPKQAGSGIFKETCCYYILIDDKNKKITVLILTMVLMSINAFCSDKPIDHIGVKGSLQFNITPFLEALKNERTARINEMILVKLPPVKITN